MKTKEDLKIPYDENTEKAICGSLLIDGESISDIIHIVSKDDFFSEVNRAIFEACLELYHRGEHIDTITVSRQLLSMKLLDKVTVAYVVGLPAVVPSSLNIMGYARIIHNLAVNRRVISMATRIQALAYEEMDVDKLISKLEQETIEVQKQVSLPKLIEPKDLAKMGYEYYAELQQGHRQGIYTGYYELDKATGGLFGGEFAILAARPSMGKTELAISMAEYVGKKLGPVLFVSLEQHWREILDRLQSRGLGISPRKIRAGNYSPDLMAQIVTELSKVAESNVYLYDSGNNVESDSVASIQSIANHMKLAYGLRAVFIDYLGLIHEGEDKIKAYERTTAISRKLKKMARVLDVPVICLCQLNREVEHRTDHTPQLSDLRDSGNLEQDADSIWFLYRPEKYDDLQDKAEKDGVDITGKAFLVIGKQRQGGDAAGTGIELGWDKNTRQYIGGVDKDIMEMPEQFR